MTYKSQPTITRPANTNAYSAGDVVGGAFQLVGFVYETDALLNSADLRPLLASIPSGMTSFALHLYDAKPPSDLADNAAWDLPSGDRANYLGRVDLGSPADLGSTLFCQVDQISKQVRTGSTGLWGYLVTNGAFTPAASSEQYVLTLQGIDLNR